MLTTDTILGAAAVSDLLQCSEKQAEELMRDRELAATKIGRGWVTTYAHVLAFLNDRIANERPDPEPMTATVGGKKARRLPELPDLRR